MEIVRTADRVADFCRKTCIKLECCPNLFGPRMVLEHCSENCSVLTKTKYSRWLSDLSSHLLSYHYFQSVACLTSCWWEPNGDRREQLHTLGLLFCHKRITMERRRASVLAVHQGATPILRGEWRGEGEGGRGGNSSLCIRRGAPQPQWTTHLLGLHRYEILENKIIGQHFRLEFIFKQDMKMVIL